MLYPIPCQAAFCGKTECPATCPHLPALTAWKAEDAAREERKAPRKADLLQRLAVYAAKTWPRTYPTAEAALPWAKCQFGKWRFADVLEACEVRGISAD